jgi:hypothetical protein
MKLRVAAAAWRLRPAKRDSHYFGHFHDLVSEAHDEGADVVVLPELHCLELLPIVPDLYEKNAAEYLAQYGDGIEEWIGRISASSGLIIVGGSHFKTYGDKIRNVCAIGVPGKGVVVADLDTDLLMQARSSGSVKNWEHRNSSEWELLGDPYPDEDSDNSPKSILEELN